MMNFMEIMCIQSILLYHLFVFYVFVIIMIDFKSLDIICNIAAVFNIFN